ncbi:uncharacterized protein LOC142767797 [Rhipicephalus microplus]|uniref:uncharacterized protein LOC142767797 n=1 Tax=Rhipicephalus microplus TaxID=6941 RepID=UPI003F6BA858
MPGWRNANPMPFVLAVLAVPPTVKKETTPSLVLFSFPSGISDNIDGRRVRLHRAPVQCSPRLKEAPHRDGSEQTMPLLLRILRIQLGIRQQQREVLQEVRQLKHKVRLFSVPQHAQPAQRPSDLPRLPAVCKYLVAFVTVKKAFLELLYFQILHSMGALFVGAKDTGTEEIPLRKNKSTEFTCGGREAG